MALDAVYLGEMSKVCSHQTHTQWVKERGLGTLDIHLVFVLSSVLYLSESLSF